MAEPKDEPGDQKRSRQRGRKQGQSIQSEPSQSQSSQSQAPQGEPPPGEPQGYLSMAEREAINNQQWRDEAIEIWPWGLDGPSMSLAEWKRRQDAGDTARPAPEG